MNVIYPTRLNIFGHEIDVRILSEPVVLGEQLVDGKSQKVLGVAHFVPELATMSIWHNPDKPSIGFTSLFHEMVEAVDTYADLQMNHTQITTLAAAFCQMWKDLPVHNERSPTYTLAA